MRENETLLFWVEKGTEKEPFKQKDADMLMIVIRQWILALENAKLTTQVKDLMADERYPQKDSLNHQVSESMDRNEVYLGSGQNLQGSGIIFNFIQRSVGYKNQRIHLTHNEAKLLKVMHKECCCVIPHEKLVLAIHNYQPDKGEAATILRPLVSRLNKKLAEIDGDPVRIKNIRGEGYMLEIVLE
jgi:DNA-binding winged helix-turn-helix (wHTH) protein